MSSVTIKQLREPALSQCIITNHSAGVVTIDIGGVQLVTLQAGESKSAEPISEPRVVTAECDGKIMITREY